MNEEERAILKKIADALETVAAELQRMNTEGITVWGGSTIEEN